MIFNQSLPNTLQSVIFQIKIEQIVPCSTCLELPFFLHLPLGSADARFFDRRMRPPGLTPLISGIGNDALRDNPCNSLNQQGG